MKHSSSATKGTVESTLLMREVTIYDGANLSKCQVFQDKRHTGTRFDENGIREKYYICLQIAVNIGCIMCVFVESQGIETEFYET